MPPVALSFWRWSIALLLLLPLAWPHLRKDKAALLKAWPMVVLLGALGVGSFNTLLYSALQHTTAINSLLLQAAQPALILGLGALAFSDVTTRAQIAGVLLSLVGVLTIVSTGDPQVLLKLRLNVGDAIMALAIVIWATYSVLLRKRPEVHPLSFLAASLMTGVAIILPFYLAELAFGRRIIWQAESIGAIGYVSIFPSLIAYLFFNRGVELIGSARAGQFLNVMPAMGVLLSVLILGERFRTYHAVGIVLIGIGIVMANWRGRSIRKPADSIQG